MRGELSRQSKNDRHEQKRVKETISPLSYQNANKEMSRLEEYRRYELEVVREWFKPAMKVLELGGGSGFQARILDTYGWHSMSIDVKLLSQNQMHYPVQVYDGSHIPAEDGTFDIVFSSNVMEHIGDLRGMLSEIRRVLKPGGLAIHILPSASWRLFAILLHYPNLPRLILRTLVPHRSASQLDAMEVPKRGIAHLIRRALIPAPHGEYPSALSELSYFSSARWLRVFRLSGFRILRCSGNGIFYSPYTMAPWLSLRSRRKLARFLGSSCNVFIMQLWDM